MTRTVIDRKSELEIIDEDYGHSLTIDSNYRNLGIEQGIVYIDFPLTKSGVIVTGRDHLQYPREVRKLRPNPKKQYLEIGAGLGGFTPNLVKRLEGRLQKKPIVIDIANYDVICGLFETGIEEAKNRGYHENILKRLEVLRGRANFYANSEQIKLITLSLGQALNTFPELVGCADVVVDNLAAEWYAAEIEMPGAGGREEKEEKVKSMKSLLLSKRGR
ncbi:MAG TPA: hypothetical protein VHA12_02760, partial [Candidatus Nanoarchaeia archaeon]|nr:hypothetical protein [Candidatus Nanoarchaeia archaeon]